MRSSLLRLALGACLLTCIAGAEAATTPGGKMVFARRADSQFLDPVLNNANVDIWVLTSLYDTLILPAKDGKSLKPGLATEWSAAADGKMLTLKLRPDTKFADGSPITADDVTWSLNRARDPKEGLWGFLLASIDSLEAPSFDTIVLHLKAPDPSLPAALATFNAAIMPHKLFEAAAGATDDDKAKTFAEHPIGSGPFMMTAWTRDSTMTLKRNPYYWAKDGDGVKLPYLDEVDFQTIPDDATRILKLRSGEADAAEFIPYARVKELQGDPSLTMNLFPSTQVTYLTTNNRPKLLDGSANPLGDERVRQALNDAINKKAIIQIVTHGIGSPMHSFFAATTPLFYDGGEAYPYDVAKAKALLADAGFAGGMTLTIQILAGSADDIATASALQQMWTPLGVKLTVEQVDATTQDDRQHKGDFQIRSSYWTNDISDPNEITSYLAYFPTNGNGYSGWQDKKIDALFEKTQVELDEAARAAEYKEIQQLYMKAAPELFLYESPFPNATRKGVKDFYQSALGNDVFVYTTVTH